eukprot:2510324-Rhodomonas_salina.1
MRERAEEKLEQGREWDEEDEEQGAGAGGAGGGGVLSEVSRALLAGGPVLKGARKKGKEREREREGEE